MCLFAICAPSSEKCLFKPFAHFNSFLMAGFSGTLIYSCASCNSKDWMKCSAFFRLQCLWNSRSCLMVALAHSCSMLTHKHFCCHDGLECAPQRGGKKGRSVCEEGRPLKWRVWQVKVDEGGGERVWGMSRGEIEDRAGLLRGWGHGRQLGTFTLNLVDTAEMRRDGEV